MKIKNIVLEDSLNEHSVAEGKEEKIAQLKKDYATAVHWSKNEKSPQKREAARQKAEKIKGHLEKQYKQGVAEGSEIKIPTEDGITMQDIRLMAGEGNLTKKTVLQAIAVIRKQRKEQGVAEDNSRWTVKYWDKQVGNDALEREFASKEQAEAFLSKLPSSYAKALRPSQGVAEGEEQGIDNKYRRAARKMIQVYKTNPEVKAEVDASPEFYRAMVYVTGVITNPEKIDGTTHYHKIVDELESIFSYGGEQGVAEGTGDIGSKIVDLCQKIYDLGDDAFDHVYHNAPTFAKAWDKYEGDLDSIIQEVSPKALQRIYNELVPLAQEEGILEQGVAEGKKKSEPPEADYGDDYQDMVARVKKLAGMGPLKTVYDPVKRVYKNVPTATQPGDKK